MSPAPLCVAPGVCVNGPMRHGLKDSCESRTPCLIDNCTNGEDDHAYVDGEVHVADRCRPRGFPGVANLPGMGPDAPTEANEQGGRQSTVPYAFTTMPLRALAELAKLQKYGDGKYGPGNWRLIGEESHVEHAFGHMVAHLLNDPTDDHLTHAAWRLLAALEIRLGGGEGG